MRRDHCSTIFAGGGGGGGGGGARTRAALVCINRCVAAKAECLSISKMSADYEFKMKFLRELRKHIATIQHHVDFIIPRNEAMKQTVEELTRLEERWSDWTEYEERRLEEDLAHGRRTSQYISLYVGRGGSGGGGGAAAAGIGEDITGKL